MSKARGWPGDAVIAAVLATGVAIQDWLHNWRLDAHKVDQTRWPVELSTIIERHSLSTESVDVRYTGAIIGRVWKMPASESIMAAYIECFNLKPVSKKGPEIQHVRATLAYAWKWPDHQDVRCYAQPVEMPPIPEGGTLVMLVYSKSHQELICYHYFNF